MPKSHYPPPPSGLPILLMSVHCASVSSLCAKYRAIYLQSQSWIGSKRVSMYHSHMSEVDLVKMLSEIIYLFWQIDTLCIHLLKEFNGYFALFTLSQNQRFECKIRWSIGINEISYSLILSGFRHVRMIHMSLANLCISEPFKILLQSVQEVTDVVRSLSWSYYMITTPIFPLLGLVFQSGYVLLQQFWGLCFEIALACVLAECGQWDCIGRCDRRQIEGRDDGHAAWTGLCQEGDRQSQYR